MKSVEGFSWWRLIEILLSGGFLLGVCIICKDLMIKHIDNRKELKKQKADKEDRTKKLEEMLSEFIKSEQERNEKYDKKLDQIENVMDNNSKALQKLLLKEIRELGNRYIQDKEVDYDDRALLNAMHRIYHYGLNGNGDADLIMKQVNDLPLKPEGK